MVRTCLGTGGARINTDMAPCFLGPYSLLGENNPEETIVKRPDKLFNIP